MEGFNFREPISGRITRKLFNDMPERTVIFHEEYGVAFVKIEGCLALFSGNIENLPYDWDMDLPQGTIKKLEILDKLIEE